MAETKIDPLKTALLIIDMQKHFLDGHFLEVVRNLATGYFGRGIRMEKRVPCVLKRVTRRELWVHQYTNQPLNL